MEALRAELPATTLERVAIPVLACEVHGHLLAARDQVGPEGIRREHRVPSRVVRDREHIDPGSAASLARARLPVRPPVP